MKVTVNWLKKDAPSDYDMQARTSEGFEVPLGARVQEDTQKCGPSPKEVTAAGIAGCTMVDVVSMLKKMRQPLEGVEVSCDVDQNTDGEYPTVFKRCLLEYRVSGEKLAADRVIRAVYLSYTKYCGVSAMIKKSGCVFTPRLVLNGEPLDIFKGHEHVPFQKTAILLTGEELMNGKTQDTNGAFLARELAKIGRPVVAMAFCGDRKAKLLEMLSELSHDADTIVMTGGLGPTSDDLTGEVVAEFFGKKQVFHEKAWENCVDAYARFGRKEIPETNRKQAMLPEGSEVLWNHLGTASGFVTHGTHNGYPMTVVALPGVPHECEALARTLFAPLTPANEGRTHRSWTLMGVGESKLQEILQELESEFLKTDPQVGLSYRARNSMVTYTVSALDMHKEFMFSAVEKCLSDKASRFRIYNGADEPWDWVCQNLAEKGVKLVVLESGTRGQLTQELMRSKRASQTLAATLSLSGELPQVLQAPKQTKNPEQNLCENLAHATQNFGGHVGVWTELKEGEPTRVSLFVHSDKRDLLTAAMPRLTRLGLEAHPTQEGLLTLDSPASTFPLEVQLRRLSTQALGVLCLLAGE